MNRNNFSVDLENALRRICRDEIVEILEANGFQCYDSETKEVLYEALVVNIEDGTISDNDVIEKMER